MLMLRPGNNGYIECKCNCGCGKSFKIMASLNGQNQIILAIDDPDYNFQHLRRKRTNDQQPEEPRP